MRNTVATCMDGRTNNFDALRLAAAVAVVFSHSFPLTQGYISGHDPDPLDRLTHFHITIGTCAVAVFFFISGFLITLSYQRATNVVAFFKARALRIFPALWIVVLLTVFVLGPIFTIYPLGTYFTNQETSRYMLTMLLRLHGVLPGVFVHNPFPNAVDGSLWTLPYEFYCYIAVGLMGILFFLRRPLVPLVFVSACIMHYRSPQNNMVYLMQLFSSGMTFYILRKYIPIRLRLFIPTAVLLVVSVFWYSAVLEPFVVLIATYVVFYVGLEPRINLRPLTRRGDFSYGLYIYAFPIQQSVTFIFGGHISWWANFALSLPITFAFAVLSWNLVEKNALKLK